MKKLLLNYIKMLKSGFYLKTYLFALLLIIPSLINGLCNVNIGYYEIPYVIIIGFIIMFSGINGISENRYVFCLTLPIRTRDIIKMAYVNTYIIYILSFCITIFISIFSNQKIPSLYLLIIVIFVLVTNILYPTIASSELKTAIYQQEDIAIWIFLVLIGMTFTICINIAINTYLHLSILPIVIASLTATFTVKKSYIAALKKVME